MGHCYVHFAFLFTLTCTARHGSANVGGPTNSAHAIVRDELMCTPDEFSSCYSTRRINVYGPTNSAHAIVRDELTCTARRIRLTSTTRQMWFNMAARD